MKKIFMGYYKELYLGDLEVEGEDICMMSQEALEEFEQRAENLGYTDLDDNIRVDYREEA